ncbi:MAG: right-handed parallel beta-helix repeat-containing protein [Polyangiaceae bacterium]
MQHSKSSFSIVLSWVLVGGSLFGVHCGSEEASPGTDAAVADAKAGGGDGGIQGDGNSTNPGDSGDDGGVIDTTTCAAGTYEFPFRSGSCIDDPCDPDPCGGTGTCSNVTGSAVCTACTLFVDSSGGADTNDGKTPAAAWKTLAKVNAATLAAGDNVCLKRGETFAGGIVVNQSGASGKPIAYGNYGDSKKPKPIVSGLVTLSGFTAQGAAGVWKAPCPSCGARVNVVLVGGVSEPMGRYPNASAANGGYLTYESVIGPPGDKGGLYVGNYAGALGIVDNELKASPNWTGAEVVVRKVAYVLDRSTVTSHTGTTIQYQNPNAPSIYVGLPGWGYFLQDSLQTLDETGEWFYDAAKKELDLFSGAAAPSALVEASTVDTLFRIANKSNVVVDGIRFRGANGNAIHLNQAKGVLLSSIDVEHSGKNGIYLGGTDGITIRNSTVTRSGNTGILAQHTAMNTSIVHNVVQYSGVVPGAGPRLEEKDEGNHCGIAVGGGIADENMLIDTNVVDRSGYNGVHFVASGVTVKNNVVTNATLLLDDGGGIYTWRGAEVYVNRKIDGNVVLDTPGNSFGKPTADAFSSSCIYLDNATSNIEVTNNTMARATRASLLSNYAHDAKVIGNLAYDSRQGAEIWSLPNAPITNATYTDNVWFSTREDQLVMNVSAATGQLPSFGTFDRNFYVRPTQNDVIINSTIDGNDYRSHSLASWRAYYGFDANSSVTPVVLKTYATPKLSGANAFPTGDFEAGIGTVIVYSPTNNATTKANATSKLTGTGSLEISYANAIRQNSRIYTSSGAGVGPVSSTKTYLLRVSTLGTTERGILTASIGQRGSPFANLTPVQKRAFGTKRVDHEFVFIGPQSDAAATFSIGIDERSGTTYVDGIEFYEVTAAPLKIEDSLRFEVNAKTAPKTIALGGNYIDAKGVPRSGSLVLPPLSGMVLIKAPEG